MLRLNDRKSERLDGIDAREAVFSPDGRWLLYQRQPNPDLRRAELGVFLEPFPRTGAQYPLPSGAGHPLWMPNGNEIYVNSVGLSEFIPVKTTPSVTFGEPIEVERTNRFEPNPVPPTSRRNVDAVPNSDRLLGVLTPLASSGNVYEIRVVLNWIEELRQRVPTR